jgi:hypothetical protein
MKFSVKVYTNGVCYESGDQEVLTVWWGVVLLRHGATDAVWAVQESVLGQGAGEC